MRLNFLLLLFFFVFEFLDAEEKRGNQICSEARDVINAEPERNADGIYPNDEVVLSENGTFKTYDQKNKNISEFINSCFIQSCGKNSFPHGFSISFLTNIPLMQCEEHRCVNPESIKCRKTTEYNACSGMNEWVAGFIPHKNETHEWLEVDCCQSTENKNKSLFVKIISPSLAYKHDIVVDDNGKLIAMDYIKTIKKAKDIFGRTTYSASIYRMKCSSSFDATNISKIIVNSTELYFLEDGGIRRCNKNTNIHYLSINHRWKTVNRPKRICLPENCLNHKNIKCSKNVKSEDCVGKNQWVANIKKRENSTENELDVECCEFAIVESVTPEFHKVISFMNTHVEINDDFDELVLYSQIYYINNITVDYHFKNIPFYIGNIYTVECKNSIKNYSPLYVEKGSKSFDVDRRKHESKWMKAIKNISMDKSLPNPYAALFG